ncbi:MAG: Rieske 2Fe-2S domain-containing protein, partial [Chloroflexota bacterium]
MAATMTVHTSEAPRAEVQPRWRRAGLLDELAVNSHTTVQLDGRVLVLWRAGEQVYAVDNRCPHMGFPLDRGTCADGLLTCHWHQARFDLRTGGTFDPWADDVPTFPVELRGGEVWVDMAERRTAADYYGRRLREGLEQNLRLVLAKSAVALLDAQPDARGPLREALEFGVKNRRAGWGSGLTMLVCLARLLPQLAPADRPKALFHGLDAVARDSAGAAPDFLLEPLPGEPPAFPTLKRWFRQFMAVRDADAGRRAVVSAVRAGFGSAQLAEMLFSAATDYRYLDGSHAADFINRALDALDLAGWEPALAEHVLSSVVAIIAGGSRQEENNAWRRPIDLVELLQDAYTRLDAAVSEGSGRPAFENAVALAGELLGDDPRANVEALVAALRQGARLDQIGEAVARAAELRVAAFHLSNEFGDWDTVHHTFTYANAIHMGLRRLAAGGSREGQLELLRGALDGAMSVYLGRFLNVPATPLPQASTGRRRPTELLELLDQRQQVNQSAGLVTSLLADAGTRAELPALLGQALLREDRDFHTIQHVEASLTQY